ncbi:hypothetical protein [uncultured Jatrophihabitans sp.]|uniref:hypothetical protein n=1 Tax=uncultured Jatrophihabitans sp. TaxID=1610747 RepID=UPI0035CBB0C6
MYATDTKHAPSCIGVDAYGVDVSRLSHRFTQNHITYGQAELIGVFDKGRLRVKAQGPASLGQVGGPRVPCSAPAGGWAKAKPSPPGIVTPWVNLAAMGRYKHAHTASTLRIASLAASKTQAVAVIVTTANVRAVRAALAPSYPRALCVVRSRYTRSEINRTASRLLPLIEEQPVHAPLTQVEAVGFGYDFAPDGQMCTVLTLPTMTRRVAKIVDAQPAGIVQVTTFLRRA